MLKDEFIRIVRSEMDRQGLSQSELARRMGIPQQMVSRYISGKHTPGLDVVEKFFLELGVELAFSGKIANRKVPAA